MQDDESHASPAICKPAANLLIGICLLWSGFLLLGTALSDPVILPFVMVANFLMLLPIFMIADSLAGRLTIDASGIERRGLYQRQRLTWSEVDKISLHSGRGRYRDLIVRSRRSRRDKIVLSTMRKDFWPAARLILTHADRHGIRIAAPWLCSGRDGWLAGEPPQATRQP